MLGGTFDPVHLGHLRICVELRERLGLDHVRLVPNRVPPHRDAPRASNAVRAQWIADAIADEPGLVLDSIELDRDGPSYTADTLAVLRERFPDSPLVCILGQDAFDGLVTWFRWEDIGELAHVVVVPRPGTPSSPVESLPGLMRTDRIEDLQQSLHGRLLAANVTPLAVSSTQVRRLLVQGRSVRYLVPDAVWHALAQTSEQSPPVYDA
ncbi:nicotinate-nucleotide adenylyltransferase [Abyssibacter sp.]|uniref:nicotinate-nucleotide adenylyltransferase n=1 Tax=Abyssibacter sp. TaxID=2320200 RepID=UPI0025C2F18C|nr:nicotinate-nucleotide adenylyltransferase [Abyssibacter sp.]MCK5859276.1 nicotinate-nucleotide adenylyltransferase [Abyssibacter sp.]